MALNYKQIKYKFFDMLPLILLFVIALSGTSIVEVGYFSLNVHYIIVYYFVLRKPETFGYGFIFLSGIFSDVILGFPIGINTLSLLIIAAVAAYIRNVTVRITLMNDWISFIPAVLLTNFIYFIALYLSNYSIDYLSLVMNCFFTFIFYPILWALFSFVTNLNKI